MRIGASTRLRTARRCPAMAGRDTPEPTAGCTVGRCAVVPTSTSVIGQGTPLGASGEGAPLPQSRSPRKGGADRLSGKCPPANDDPPATMSRQRVSKSSCASIRTGVAAGTGRVVHVAPGQLPHRPGSPRIDRKVAGRSPGPNVTFLTSAIRQRQRCRHSCETANHSCETANVAIKWLNRYSFVIEAGMGDHRPGFTGRTPDLIFAECMSGVRVCLSVMAAMPHTNSVNPFPLPGKHRPIGCDVNGRDDNPGHDGPELATAQNDLNDTNALNDQIDMTVPADSADNPASDDNNDREVVTQSSRPAHQADTSTGTKRSGLRRKVILVGAAATIGLLAVGGATAASLAKTVTITVDGQQRQVTTLAGSVDGALSSAGLQAGEHDVLAPAAGTHISDGAQIALEHGRLLTLTINGQERQVWTTATTVDEALSQLGQDPNAYQLSADRAREIPLDGLSVTADPLRTVSLSDGGAAAAPVKTGGRTVADVLGGLNTPLGPTDTVVPD